MVDCFVMMPFDKRFNRVYNDGIQRALERAGVAHTRADQSDRPGDIVKQVFEDIAKAKFCIVDVTGDNPNVFAELGYALACEKPLILLTQDLFTQLPFDVRNLRAIVYETGRRGLDELADRLGRAIKELRRSEERLIEKKTGVRFFVSTPLAGCGTEEEYAAFMGRMCPMLNRIRGLKGVENAYYFNEAYPTIEEFEKIRWTVSEYLERINEADYFVMIVNTASVSGVYFESGYALARGMKSIYFVGPEGKVPELMKRSAAAYPTLVQHLSIDRLEDVPILLEEIIKPKGQRVESD